LAFAGVLFAYFVSLPAALHFLAKFGGAGVQSLITVDEYFNFALAYLAGFALLFQLPLLILFVNRIKPLTPGKMMGAQRFVILISFIVAAILTPTPDPFNQLLMAAPAIVLYQIGIIMVMIVNRGSKPVVSQKLPNKIEYNINEKIILTKQAVTQPQHLTRTQPPSPVPAPVRRGRMFMDIIPPSQKQVVEAVAGVADEVKESVESPRRIIDMVTG
jgi:sec-independent protein translocase protein TatC